MNQRMEKKKKATILLSGVTAEVSWTASLSLYIYIYFRPFRNSPLEAVVVHAIELFAWNSNTGVEPEAYCKPQWIMDPKDALSGAPTQ